MLPLQDFHALLDTRKHRQTDTRKKIEFMYTDSLNAYDFIQLDRGRPYVIRVENIERPQKILLDQAKKLESLLPEILLGFIPSQS